LDKEGKDIRRIVERMFIDSAVYGKVFSINQIPDFSEKFDIESERRFLQEYREFFLNPQVTAFSKSFLPAEVKESFDYERKLNDYEAREGQLPAVDENSGYAFACFSSFEAVSRFKRFAVKSFKKALLFRQIHGDGAATAIRRE
jgi:hypothetical protein